MQQCRIWRAKQNEDFKNDNIAIDPEKVQPSTQSAIQSVKNDNELSLKCNNCTLEERELSFAAIASAMVTGKYSQNDTYLL